MALFKDVERTYEGPIAAGETHFAYLNRSARPEAGRIRQFLNECLDHFPAEHHAGLIARLRSNDRAHEPAIFELLVHELVLRAGHKVLSIEPALEHTSKTPDFLVESPTAERFYVECVVATGQTDAEASAERRLQQALEAAESVASPHHVLSLNVDGRPTASVTISQLKQQLAHWISTLPMSDDAKSFPSFRYEEHELTLEFLFGDTPNLHARPVSDPWA